MECLFHTYTPPDARQLAASVEDALACPLSSLGLLRQSPGQRSYYLASGPQPGLPDALVAWATLAFVREGGLSTAAFNDLAFSPGSPGRVFRLDGDGLLSRLLALAELTGGRLVYNDQAGIRQVWALLLQQPTVRHIDRFLERPRRFGAVRDELARLPCAAAPGFEATMAWQTLMRWLFPFLPARYARPPSRHSEVVARVARDA